MINFPTLLDFYPGMTPKREVEPRYVVEKFRDADRYSIWLRDNVTGSAKAFGIKSFLGEFGFEGQFHAGRAICLHWHWWRFSSPADRIRTAVIKAQAKADRLNHIEMYTAHEATLAGDE